MTDIHLWRSDWLSNIEDNEWHECRACGIGRLKVETIDDELYVVCTHCGRAEQ